MQTGPFLSGRRVSLNGSVQQHRQMMPFLAQLANAADAGQQTCRRRWCSAASERSRCLSASESCSSCW